MSHSTPDEPSLFDLPLAPPPGDEGLEGADPRDDSPVEEPAARATRGRRRRGERAEPPASLSLFEEPEGASSARAGRSARPGPRPVPPTPDEPAEGEEGVAIARRARAAIGDLVVLAAVGAIAATGARALGAPIGPAQAAPLGVFLLSWSFLYTVISLAFWGQTPGMAWAGLEARSAGGEPLSFGQTSLRWAGIWLTWALAGLPGLLALTGASLADRLSGSRLYEASDELAAPPARA